MRRGRFIGLMLASAVSVALAGCTSFAPVYGDRSGAGAETYRFQFAAPKNRMEQLILNRLGVAFPLVAGPNDPVLTVTAVQVGRQGVQSDSFKAQKPIPVRVEATLTIRRGDEVVFEAKRFADTDSETVGQVLAQNMANTGAEENAARSTAESLRLAILAGYRPAN